MYSATVVGPILRKRWIEFVTQKLVLLFHRSGVGSMIELLFVDYQ